MLHQSLQDKLTALCMPNPDYIPDPKERNLITNKTKVHLLFLIIFFFTLTLRAINAEKTTFSMVFLICKVFLLIITLLICCRSYLQTYYIILTSIMCINAIVLTYKGEVHYPLSTGFFGTIVVYLVTDRWPYYVSTGIIYSISFRFFLNHSLKVAIVQLGPDDFCDKLVNDASIHLGLIVFFLCPLHIALKDINQDLKDSKVAVENSLSHYKTFLFSFSHEIRNPINIVLGSLEMALQERLPSSALKMVQTAKISGELLLQLINNVLDVGKAEVEKLEIVPTPTRVHDLLIRMWSISSELIKKKKLCGYLKVSMDLPNTIELDPDRLNQVLLNLLSNAVKFTQNGSINLTIEWLPGENKVSDESFEPLPFNQEEEGVFDKNECISTFGYSTGFKPGRLNNFYTLTHLQKTINQDMSKSTLDSNKESMGLLKIIVKDQGCGMSQEAMKGLFKKFYQCNSEASQRKRGTGLGLYITKDICESMGGQIRVYSEVNRGTVFIVCIPCKRLNS